MAATVASPVFTTSYSLAAQRQPCGCACSLPQRRRQSAALPSPSSSSAQSLLRRQCGNATWRLSQPWHGHPFPRRRRPLPTSPAPPARAQAAAAAAAAGDSSASSTSSARSAIALPYQTRSEKNSGAVTLVTLCVVALSVASRVLFKMALVPLQRYTFFLAQFLTVGNCVAYLAILTARRNSSPAAIPDEMLAYPKASFVLIGALEALGLAAGCVVAAALPGALLPVLQQTFLFWQLLLSAVFLGARFAASQVVGAALVMAGVALSVFASNNTAAATATEVFGVVNKSAYPYIYMASLAFPAAATILKEAVFRDARQRLACGSMDLFVLNSFSSLFQALFVLLFLPAISAYQGIAWAELPAYLSAGAACFLGRGGPECAGAPLLAVAYVLANLAFNIVAVYLLKISSAVVPSLAISASVPLTVLAFTLPLPFIGAPPVLDNAFYAGAGVLFLGLIVYNTAAATAFRKIAAVVAAGTNAAATRAAASS